MPAEGTMSQPQRRKVYVDGPRRVRVPFNQIDLTDGSSVRLYDTSGPGSVPEEGLAPLRRDWIGARGDVEEYEGRPTSARDDGRAAVRRGTSNGAGNSNGNGAADGNSTTGTA